MCTDTQAAHNIVHYQINTTYCGWSEFKPQYIVESTTIPLNRCKDLVVCCGGDADHRSPSSSAHSAQLWAWLFLIAFGADEVIFWRELRARSFIARCTIFFNTPAKLTLTKFLGLPFFIYLDNAATSFPKPESVYAEQDYAARNYGANPGRGSYEIARMAAQVMASTREAIADLFNISPSSRIAFTCNATQGINIALSGLLEPEHRVVTTSIEHNAVIRPLHHLQHHGIEVFKVTADARGLVTPEDIYNVCREVTPKLVVITHCSNVTGAVQPVAEIGRFCHEHGIIFMLDAAQSAGVLPIDVEAMHIDILVAPGHKALLGPQGTGFLYVRDGLKLKPLIRGGTGNLSSQAHQPTEMPELLESGTPNATALAGLRAGIKYILQRGMENIRAHELCLLQLLWSGLGEIPGVRCYGPEPGPRHSGLISFTLDNHTTAEVGFFLDQQFNIGVRTGLHCAPDAHKTIGTYPGGTVRVSPGCFNTEQHIYTFIQAIKSITSQPS